MQLKLGHVLLCALLVLLGAGLHQARRQYIRSWFVRGAARPMSGQPPASSGPLRPVRVVLVDGLGERTARALPALQRLCRSGLRLRVDVGFPSVSLSVQHALWTGAWQSTSGVLFPYDKIDRPAYPSVPSLVARGSADAVAIAESHREIVASFPFTRIVAPPRDDPPLPPLTVQRETLAAAQSTAPLVFVHLLGVDEAGHTAGALSRPYREAAARADELIAALWQARGRASWTLLVISDHGHLAQGGHGDLEDEVRHAPACVVGSGIAPGSVGAATIPDLARLIADRLNVSLPAVEGRPLAEVMDARGGAPSQPSRLALGATAPGLLLSAALLAALLWLARRGARPAQSLLLGLPWAQGLGLVLLVVAGGAPSLSHAYVYPHWPTLLLAAGALPTALATGLQLRLLLQARLRLEPTIAVGLLATGALLPAVVVTALSGWPLRVPPLSPFITGWASTLQLLAAASLVATGAWAFCCGALEDRPVR
jgi:hypothetical protein